MTKKYLIIAFIISAGVAFGVFSYAPMSRTIYIKNDTNYTASADNVIQATNSDGQMGDLSNTIIPPIKTSTNITEDLANAMTQQMIYINNNIKVGDLLPNPGVNMPDPNKIAQDFITNGLQKANENILNIEQSQLIVSSDNSKIAIGAYLANAQKIINDNLGSGDSLFSILDEINKNNGQGIEKLIPIISAHEAAAKQIEELPVPSSLKDLMTEEIRLLRITANVLRPLTNIENDPVATIAATGQYGVIMENWQNLQKKFNVFIEKLNNS